jgi:hypothetical protein
MGAGEAAVTELRRALLEIEWASRKKATTTTLTRINTLARAALRPADLDKPGLASPEYVPQPS